MKAPKLAEHYSQNFTTLTRAFKNEHVALISAVRKSDQVPVALIIAMQEDKDGDISIIPFAEMINGNPYELYEDPTADLEEE